MPHKVKKSGWKQTAFRKQRNDVACKEVVFGREQWPPDCNELRSESDEYAVGGNGDAGPGPQVERADWWTISEADEASTMASDRPSVHD